MNHENIETANAAPVVITPGEEAGIKKEQIIVDVQNQLQALSDKLGEIIQTMNSSANLIRSWIDSDTRHGN